MTTMAEMSRLFGEAHTKPFSAESDEGGETNKPQVPATPADENEKSPPDGQAMVPAPEVPVAPEPTAKTPEEMAMDPKQVLADEVDQKMVDEMGAPEAQTAGDDAPDGRADEPMSKPGSMDAMSISIKNAGKELRIDMAAK